MTIRISDKFDSGAIVVVDLSSPSNIRLRIRDDSGGEFRQWFHFRVQGGLGQNLTLNIENAGECSYADGFYGYQAVASYNRRDWFRVPTTTYDGKVLSIQIAPERQCIWFAYFQPYSQERHLDFVGRCADAPGVRLLTVGQSIEKRDIDLIKIGDAAADKKNVWIIARQHPGETMAEWFTEGLLSRLLDASDPVAREVRRLACVHVVPNINPDGAFLGNLRTNAAGTNLNREWLNPSLETSPEVWWTQRAMKETGIDLFLDIHGDETLPYVFIDGSHMVPNYGERNLQMQLAFLENLKIASPDFQTEHGYATNRFGKELLTLASKWVAHTFGCVSLTLEMPFKDNANAPDPHTGWNGARSQRMGAAMLGPILQHLIAIRTPDQPI